MDLAIQACLLLAKKNHQLLLQDRASEEGAGSEGNDREDSVNDSSRGSLSAKRVLRRSKIIRTKTAILPPPKIRAKKRFARKQSAELLRKRSVPRSELDPTSEPEYEEEPQTSSEEALDRSSRIVSQSAVKKTGRGPGRPRLSPKKKNLKVEIKRRMQASIKNTKTTGGSKTRKLDKRDRARARDRG